MFARQLPITNNIQIYMKKRVGLDKISTVTHIICTLRNEMLT